MSARRPLLLATALLLSSAPGWTSAAESAPSFRTDVMAALSKAGCNLGTCHGNATGKGGFKLSLRGQDLDLDFKREVPVTPGLVWFEKWQ